MIFGINTTSDISKLLYANLRQFWNITSGIYAKYHAQIMLLFVYTTTHERFVIFTCRYFKLSWNTTALSQSNCRNFSRSSIKRKTTVGINKYILSLSFLPTKTSVKHAMVWFFLPYQYQTKAETWWQTSGSN